MKSYILWWKLNHGFELKFRQHISVIEQWNVQASTPGVFSFNGEVAIFVQVGVFVKIAQLVGGIYSTWNLSAFQKLWCTRVFLWNKNHVIL